MHVGGVLTHNVSVPVHKIISNIVCFTEDLDISEDNSVEVELSGWLLIEVCRDVNQLTCLPNCMQPS